MPFIKRLMRCGSTRATNEQEGTSATPIPSQSINGGNRNTIGNGVASVIQPRNLHPTGRASQSPQRQQTNASVAAVANHRQEMTQSVGANPALSTTASVVQSANLPCAESMEQLQKRQQIRADLVNWRREGGIGEQRAAACDLILDCLRQNDTRLNLAHLNLSTVPASIGQLTPLEELALDHNKLTSLPDSICNLQNLQRLHLNNNQLTALPTELGSIAQLRTIRASHNALENLPSSVANLDKLLNVELDHNRLSQLQAEFRDFRPGITLSVKGNPFPIDFLRRTYDTILNEAEYDGPKIFLDKIDTDQIAGIDDPLAAIETLQKIEMLLHAADNMEDGRSVLPENIKIGSRNMTRKEALMMALEFALDSNRELVPTISDRAINDLPVDTMKFLVKGVSFKRERIKEWSNDQGLSLNIGVAREVIEVEQSYYETGDARRHVSDGNVHDQRVRGNYKRQFELIVNRVGTPRSSVQMQAEIRNHIATAPERTPEARQAALAGLDLIMTKDYKAYEFPHSAIDTLAYVWTHIENASPTMRANL